MNARCYGMSISDILRSVTYIDRHGHTEKYIARAKDFGYKKSPFQISKNLIYEVEIELAQGEKSAIRSKMSSYKKDRHAKGHFTYPCAGSVFKNNRAFGLPSGKIIDALGLRGFSIGEAAVSPDHANIIINRGKARAQDVRRLIEAIEDRVYRAHGIRLEREIILVGDWD